MTLTANEKAVDEQFTAILQKSPAPGGWTYVMMPGSAEYLSLIHI